MEAGQLLDTHHLKRTACREGIINVITTADEALSEDEIRKRLIRKYDRTTLYRSFKTLEESHIIHRIVIDSQLVKYALVDTPYRDHRHIHFYCNNCNKVLCMESKTSMDIHLPDGYTKDETEIIIKGMCAVCKRQKQTNCKT